MQICSKCNQFKDETDFHKKRKKNGTIVSRTMCKSCVRSYGKDWYVENKPIQSARRKAWRDSHVEYYTERQFKRIGVTAEQYNLMLESQGGVCAICENKCSSGKRLSVDHDHSCCPSSRKACGRCVRALLCMNCNQALGKFKDDPTLVHKASEYLSAWRTVKGLELLS